MTTQILTSSCEVSKSYRFRFVGCEQEEVQKDFVDQRVFDHLFSETEQQKM